MKYLSVTAALCCLVLLSPGPRAGAAEPDWKVGLARVKITPERPVFLAGYASRNRPFDKVATDLYAKALALEDRDGHVAVLVTTDLIGLTADVAEPVCERLAGRAGLKREQVLLSSSHIHTGPILSLDPKPHDNESAGDAQRTVEYTHQLQDKLVEVVVRALARREPARLSWGSGVANFVMNRREFTPNGVILGVNARGPADRTVPVLRIDRPDGKPRAVLFGAATHNTTLTEQCYEVCGDYAGFAQDRVEERYPGAQAMFLLGCAGDSNPYPPNVVSCNRAESPRFRRLPPPRPGRAGAQRNGRRARGSIAEKRQLPFRRPPVSRLALPVAPPLLSRQDPQVGALAAVSFAARVALDAQNTDWRVVWPAAFFEEPVEVGAAAATSPAEEFAAVSAAVVVDVVEVKQALPAFPAATLAGTARMRAAVGHQGFQPQVCSPFGSALIVTLPCGLPPGGHLIPKI